MTTSERSSVQIRYERDGERSAVQDVVFTAFEDAATGEGARVAGLERALRAGSAGRDDFSLVAVAEGEICGQVLLTRSWLDAPATLVPVWVLSPLSVRPCAQRRGIGTALVRTALTEAGRRDMPLVFLEGDPGYYTRFGFARASTLGFTSPSVRIPDAAFQVATLGGYEPWMTGAVVYADVFWQLDCVGLRD